MTKQVHLAAHFPGVNNTTVWSDPAAGSHIEFDSFVHLAQTAERGKFDFFFLAEGLRLREQNGLIYDLDVASVSHPWPPGAAPGAGGRAMSCGSAPSHRQPSHAPSGASSAMNSGAV